MLETELFQQRNRWENRITCGALQVGARNGNAHWARPHHVASLGRLSCWRFGGVIGNFCAMLPIALNEAIGGRGGANGREFHTVARNRVRNSRERRDSCCVASRNVPSSGSGLLHLKRSYVVHFALTPPRQETGGNQCRKDFDTGRAAQSFWTVEVRALFLCFVLCHKEALRSENDCWCSADDPSAPTIPTSLAAHSNEFPPC